MEVWSKRGFIAKAVSAYNVFKEKLESDIGVSPSKRARNFYKKTLSSANSAGDDGNPGEFFRFRKREVEKILDTLLEKPDKMLVVFIHGEPGIGKTSLVSHIAKLNAFEGKEILAARPYLVGEKYPYSSWGGIVIEIRKKIAEKGIELDNVTASVLMSVFYDFTRKDSVMTNTPEMALAYEHNPHIIGRMLAELVEKLFAGTRPLLIMEDLHWFDSSSLSSLQTFLSEIKIPLTVFLTSRPESVASVTNLFYGLKTFVPKKFIEIELSPFGAEETVRFFREFLPEEVISRRGKDYFQSKSGGVPLLIVEMLHMLEDNHDADCASGLKGVLMSRMEDLSPLQREILSVLSVFSIGASVDDIASVMNVLGGDISASIEVMLDKKLVHETDNNGALSLDFLHSNVRDCVYNAIPSFQKKELHRRIADVLNSRYLPHVWNPELNAILRHHYTKADQKEHVLRQYLSEISLYITLNHDLFPMVEDRVLISCRGPFGNREDTEYKFETVSNLLYDLNVEPIGQESVNNRKLEASYLEIRGGYLVNWGEYREGRVFINRALKIASECGFDETHMYCLEHICHHFLQTDDSARLMAAGRELLYMAKKIGKENHMGMALRFIGMSMLLKRDFKLAERAFERSMAIFEELNLSGRSYTLNRLASLCYTGEMHQWSWDLDGAMERFVKCVRDCEQAGLLWGRSHFHAHAADTALDMGDWPLLFSHIDAGSAFFDISRGGRCGSMFYSLKAIRDARLGMESEALEALRLGEKLSSIGKRTWRAPQLMACAWIAQMKENGEVGSMFEEFPSRSSTDYALSAERLYREMGAAGRAGLIAQKFRL
jgi:hypothetical protein